MKLNQVQLEKLKAKFGSLKNLSWLKRPIVDSAVYMLGSVMQNFESEGRPSKWADWSMQYRAFREKVERGQIGKILTLTGKTQGARGGQRVFAGQLRNSIAYKLNPNGFNIGTNIVYAAIHQFGGPAPKGGRIPPRPFFMFQDQDIPLIVRMFQKHLDIILAA